MLKDWLIKAIKRYQVKGGGKNYNVSCNFTPSCSYYAIDALNRHGLSKGIVLCCSRLKRCNQRDLVGTINDPVPEVLSPKSSKTS